MLNIPFQAQLFMLKIVLLVQQNDYISKIPLIPFTSSKSSLKSPTSHARGGGGGPIGIHLSYSECNGSFLKSYSTCSRVNQLIDRISHADCSL